MGRFNLLDLKYILTQRWGKAFGRGFPLMSWQEVILKREKDYPNAIGFFKKVFKNNNFFPNEKHLVLSPHKMEKPPRPKIKSWVNPNKKLVIKEIF